MPTTTEEKKDPAVDPDHPKYVEGTDTPGRKPTLEELEAQLEYARAAKKAAAEESR